MADQRVISCTFHSSVQSLFPKIILESEDALKILVNPAFDEQGCDEREKIVSKKWRDERQLPELFTPSMYHTDIIELSAKNPQIDPSSLHYKYHEKGLSLRQISAETFHSRQAISEVLKAGGVRLRASGQGHGNPSQLKYGYRKEHGAVVPHLGEQQVVGAIKDLRN